MCAIFISFLQRMSHQCPVTAPVGRAVVVDVDCSWWLAGSFLFHGLMSFMPFWNSIYRLD